MLSESACGWVFAFVLAALTGATAAGAEGVAAPADGQAYPIKLNRQVKVGDKYHFVADATAVHSMHANISGRERTIRPESVYLRFDATERILAVNSRGEPSKATYTINHCVLRNDQGPQLTFLDRGRVLTVEAGRWKSSINLDEGDLKLTDEIGLRAILSLPNLKDVSADDTFGSATARRVGETWPANARRWRGGCRRKACGWTRSTCRGR